MKCKYYDGEWISGLKLLDSNRKRTWDRHVASDQHKTAVDIESQPRPENMFTFAAQKAKELTMNFLRILYSCLLMYLPYRQHIGSYVRTLTANGEKLTKRVRN